MDLEPKLLAELRRTRLDSWLFDARLAIRSLLCDRGFSLTAITTLVIAMTLNVTVLTVCEAMVVRGLPLAERSDRLVYLALRRTSDLPCCPGPVPDTLADGWRAEADALEDVAMWRSSEPITLRDDHGRPVDMSLSRWSANMLRMLGVQPVVGRDFVAAGRRAKRLCQGSWCEASSTS